MDAKIVVREKLATVLLERTNCWYEDDGRSGHFSIRIPYTWSDRSSYAEEEYMIELLTAYAEEGDYLVELLADVLRKRNECDVYVFRDIGHYSVGGLHHA